MREEDKERSIKYWNHVANKWGYMAHGEDGHLLTFPTSQVRHDIIANEIVKTNKREEKILDIDEKWIFADTGHRQRTYDD